MAIEIPRDEVSLKEEGLVHLFRADPKKFGRGFADGAKSSVPHQVPMTEGILAMARHTIDYERNAHPDVDDLRSKDYELGVVVGCWVSLKELEVAIQHNPALNDRITELGGVPS